MINFTFLKLKDLYIEGYNEYHKARKENAENFLSKSLEKIRLYNFTSLFYNLKISHKGRKIRIYETIEREMLNYLITMALLWRILA